MARQKLNLTEHDIIGYLIDNSSVDHKISINDIAEYFTVLNEIAQTHRIGDFHDLDEDQTAEVSELISDLKKGRRSIVNDSVRVQVKRLVSKFLNKPMIGGIFIRCGTNERPVKSTAREFYVETPFSGIEIAMIREAISVFPYAGQTVTENIINGLNQFTIRSNRLNYFPEIVFADKYSSSCSKAIDEIHKAFAAYHENSGGKFGKKNGVIKKLSFKYCRYNIKKKLEVYTSSSGAETRVVNPVKTVWTNGFYYLVTFEFDEQKRKPVFKNYRIDRMKDVKCLDETADSLKNHFTGKKKKVYELSDLLQKDDDTKLPRTDPSIIDDARSMDASGFLVTKYKNSSPIMYSHDIMRNIKIKCKLSIMNNAIDTFGFDFAVEKCGDSEFIMTIKEAAADGVKMWALEYGTQCEILEPEALRRSIADTVKKMNEIYSDQKTNGSE